MIIYALSSSSLFADLKMTLIEFAIIKETVINFKHKKTELFVMKQGQHVTMKVFDIFNNVCMLIPILSQSTLL